MGYLDKLRAKAENNAAGELKMLPLAALEPSSKNFYRMCEIDQLADSIAANGLEQNLVVKAERDGKYRIITGHRRYQALLRLTNRGVRVENVPCIIRPAETDAQEMLRMIASNQYRELSDYEKMVQVEQALEAVKTLRSAKVQELGGIRLDAPAREVVCRLTGMSGAAVSKYAGIAEKLIPELKAKMEQGLLPFTVAYTVCRYPADWQREVLEAHKQASGAEPIAGMEVESVAISNAVKEALYTSISDKIDPTASEAENYEHLKKEWCLPRCSESIPGGGFVGGEGDKITVTGAGNTWRVEMTHVRFVIIALGAWKRLCTGNWKQEAARKKFKDVSREALARMDGELEELPEAEQETAESYPLSAAAAAPAPRGEGLGERAEQSPAPTGRQEEESSERKMDGTGEAAPHLSLRGHLPPEGKGKEPTDAAVESGRFGKLKNELSGKSPELEDKAWDQIIVWNTERPTVDVFAVVMLSYESIYAGGGRKVELCYYCAATDSWFMDERFTLEQPGDVLGWFKVPVWEEQA